MPHVRSQDSEPERKRRGTNQQIGKRHHDTFGRLLPVDPPREQRGLVCVGIYGQARPKLLYKLLAVDA